MENGERAIVYVLLGSVFLNIFILFRINRLGQELQHYNSSGRNNIYMLENRINSIHSALHSIKEESKWTISREIKPNDIKSKPGEIYLDLHFSLRQIERDANIKVLYKSESGKLWLEAPVENIGGNSFKSLVVINTAESYQYQIVSEGSKKRISDIYEIYNRFTQPPPLNVISSGSVYSDKGTTHVNYVFAQYRPEFDFHRFKTAVAKVYIGGKLDRVIEMEPVDPMYFDPLYQSELGTVIGFESDVDQSTVIIIEVEYMDSTIHKGEIFPKEEYRNKYY